MRTQEPQGYGSGRGLAEVLVRLAERLVASPPLPATIGILAGSEDSLPVRIERLLQKERNTMTRMNLFGLLGTAAFAVAMSGVMLVANVRAEVQTAAAQAKPMSNESETQMMLAAEGFWASEGAKTEHDFSEPVKVELHGLAAQASSPALRIRAAKLLCDIKGNTRLKSEVPDEVSERVIAAAMAHMEANRTHVAIAKFCPEKGFSHIAVSTRYDEPVAESVWLLIEDIRRDQRSGLNMRWNRRTKTFDNVQHWGLDRTEHR